MQITITNSQQGFWYSGLEGSEFKAELKEMPVAGHAHKIKVYEVTEGEHQGDFVLQGDCEVQTDIFDRFSGRLPVHSLPANVDPTFRPRC